MPLLAKIQIIIAALFITYASAVARGKNVVVFSEHRPISMKNDQIPPKDFFINAGSDAGLRVGEILSVQRQQSLYDKFNNNSVNNLIVTVGTLRLIHVQPNLSVARLVSLTNYDDSPAIDYDAIMIGDQVDLSSGQMNRKTASTVTAATK